MARRGISFRILVVAVASRVAQSFSFAIGLPSEIVWGRPRSMHCSLVKNGKISLKPVPQRMASVFISSPDARIMAV